jgi:hypothetical protein
VADRPSDYVRRLPIGERLPLGEVASDPLFPFEGEFRVRPLDPPLLPEPARHGVDAADRALA